MWYTKDNVGKNERAYFRRGGKDERNERKKTIN
jgi:hypothetical protein